MENTKKRYELPDLAIAKELLNKKICPNTVNQDLFAFNEIGSKVVAVYDADNIDKPYIIVGAVKTIVDEIKMWEVELLKTLDGSCNGLDAMLEAS